MNFSNELDNLIFVGAGRENEMINLQLCRVS